MNKVNIENPMVLEQEKYDPQMQPYEMKRCDFCEEWLPKHEFGHPYGDMDICRCCRAQFLKDSADKNDFDSFVEENQKDYLLNWWWNSLDELDQLDILAEAYDRRKRKDACSFKVLADDREEYCNNREEDFLDFMEERWQ